MSGATEPTATQHESVLPDADIGGFAEWVKSAYIEDRWSEVREKDESVMVWSGKHPAFSTFQRDLRPRLHSHGLVISEMRTNVPRKIDEEMEKVHWISAVPIAKAAAAAHDMICDRGVCTNLIEHADATHCEECADIMGMIEA